MSPRLSPDVSNGHGSLPGGRSVPSFGLMGYSAPLPGGVMRSLLSTLTLGAALLVGLPAQAAGGADTVQVTEQQAGNPPRSAALLGAADGFRTGQLVRRVLAEGTAYTYSGRVRKVDPATPARVACPFRAGEGEGSCIVATELVERLADSGRSGDELSLEGRYLEVDGVRYVVLTSYRPAGS